MRVVITGASGNVGTALLRILPAEHDVVGVVRRPPAPQGVYQRADWCALDLTGQGGLADLRRVLRAPRSSCISRGASNPHATPDI